MITMSRKLVKKLIFLIITISAFAFCFYRFGLDKVIFIYPKDVEIAYKKMTGLKETKALGFTFLLPEGFVLRIKKENTVVYDAKDNNIVFVLKKDSPDLFSTRTSIYSNDYDYYNEVLTNRWNLGCFRIKYLMVSKWQSLEIKKIKINNTLKGFVFLGAQRKWSQRYKNYLYELFDKDYRLTVAIRVSKEENFGEREINYLISTITKEASTSTPTREIEIGGEIGGHNELARI